LKYYSCGQDKYLLKGLDKEKRYHMGQGGQNKYKFKQIERVKFIIDIITKKKAVAFLDGS
jgi:hypothetical protein